MPVNQFSGILEFSTHPTSRLPAFASNSNNPPPDYLPHIGLCKRVPKQYPTIGAAAIANYRRHRTYSDANTRPFKASAGGFHALGIIHSPTGPEHLQVATRKP